MFPALPECRIQTILCKIHPLLRESWQSPVRSAHHHSAFGILHSAFQNIPHSVAHFFFPTALFPYLSHGLYLTMTLPFTREGLQCNARS